MAISVTGKLNKAATQFAAGESTGFGVRLGVKYYDRQTKQDAWTNYEAVIFAKAPAQIQYYQQVLVEGAIIEVSGDKCAIKQFQGANGLVLAVEILDAKLGAAYGPNQPAPQGQPQQQQQQQNRPAPQPQQQAYNQQQQQRPIGYQNGAATPNYHNPAPQQQPYNPAPQQQNFQQQPPYNQQQQIPNQQGLDDDIPF
jgi:single-strand DNA-binding protein